MSGSGVACLLALVAVVALQLPHASSAAGFRVSGTTILDHRGQPFVARGINYAYSSQKKDLFRAVPFIYRTKANTVRAVLSDGSKYPADSRKDVQNIITLCSKYNLALVLEVQDASGSSDEWALEKAAQYWISLASVLKGHEDRVIINIASNWFNSNMLSLWERGYRSVIPKLRAAGLSHMLIVDAAGFGQLATSVAQHGKNILAADKLRNVAFGLHLYGVGAKDNASVKRNIDAVRGNGLAVIVTEFSAKHRKQTTAFQFILSYTRATNVGWIAWSLYGNKDADEDLAHGPDGQLTFYGNSVINGPNGIKQTSRPLSPWVRSSGASNQAHWPKPNRPTSNRAPVRARGHHLPYTCKG